MHRPYVICKPAFYEYDRDSGYLFRPESHEGPAQVRFGTQLRCPKDMRASQ